MTVAAALQNYLDQTGVNFDLIDHRPTYSASQTAQASHVSGKAIAKAVLLKDEEGYLLAVLPASRQIRFDELKSQLHRNLFMASEEEAAAKFSDCETGALPPVGEAYGLEVVLDDTLADRSDVYFEGGDHHTLLHVKGEAFNRLMDHALHGHFSLPV